MVMDVASAETLCGAMLDLALCLTCLAIAARVVLGSVGARSRSSARRQLLLYLYLLSLGLMLAGVGRAATALAHSTGPGVSATSAGLLPPVMALAASLLSIAAASLLALAAPRLVRQLEMLEKPEEPSPSVGDLEKGSPGAVEPQTKKSWTSGPSRTPSARLVDDKLRPTAEALELNSKQAMLLIAALCELSRSRAHWSRKPDETWGRFLQALHEIVAESKARPMLPAESWYEVARWYSTLSDSRLTQLLRAALVFHSSPKPKAALKLANLLWANAPSAPVHSNAKAEGSVKCVFSI